MKVLLFIVVILVGCKNQGTERATQDNSQTDSHLQFEKASQELKKFQNELASLYTESLTNTEKIILKADSLLVANESEKDPIRLRIKPSVSNSLHYLKAELFFKLGNYDKSILELNKLTYVGGDVAIALASNYSKLKRYDKAKSFIDSIGNGFYLHDYVLGNYYENIGDRKEALKIYREITVNESIKHYGYYELAVKRIEKLQKRTPILLNEIYFPTRNPKFEFSFPDKATEE